MEFKIKSFKCHKIFQEECSILKMLFLCSVSKCQLHIFCASHTILFVCLYYFLCVQFFLCIKELFLAQNCNGWTPGRAEVLNLKSLVLGQQCLERGGCPQSILGPNGTTKMGAEWCLTSLTSDRMFESLLHLWRAARGSGFLKSPSQCKLARGIRLLLSCLEMSSEHGVISKGKLS